MLADEHPRGACVVEVDVREEQVADVRQREAVRREPCLQRVDADVGPQSKSAGPSFVSTT